MKIAKNIYKVQQKLYILSLIYMYSETRHQILEGIKTRNINNKFDFDLCTWKGVRGKIIENQVTCFKRRSQIYYDHMKSVERTYGMAIRLNICFLLLIIPITLISK